MNFKMTSPKDGIALAHSQYAVILGPHVKIIKATISVERYRSLLRATSPVRGGEEDIFV